MQDPARDVLGLIAPVSETNGRALLHGVRSYVDEHLVEDPDGDSVAHLPEQPVLAPGRHLDGRAIASGQTVRPPARSQLAHHILITFHANMP